MDQLIGFNLRAKRVSAGISGEILCLKRGIGRTKLSSIERGTISVPPEEIARIDSVLDELIRAKSVSQKTAAALGWPVATAVGP